MVAELSLGYTILEDIGSGNVRKGLLLTTEVQEHSAFRIERHNDVFRAK
jgi:hypothetical protein